MSDITIQTQLDVGGNDAGASSAFGANGSYVPPGNFGQNGQPFSDGDAERLLYGLPPQEVANIQWTLSEVGILRKDYTRGRVGPETLTAYEEVLRLSNVEARAPSVILSEMSAQGLGSSVAKAAGRLADEQSRSAGPTRAPFTARVSNPNDLRKYFREAILNATGEYRSQVDVDQMVEAYQAIERNAQAAAYNAAPSGGTVTAPESVESFTERTLEEVVPDQVQTRDVVDRAGQLFGMLGSFGGQA